MALVKETIMQGAMAGKGCVTAVTLRPVIIAKLRDVGYGWLIQAVNADFTLLAHTVEKINLPAGPLTKP